MEASGFIKLYRKFVSWGWYSDPTVKDVFLHLLIVASWKPGTYMGHDIKPGQAIIGRKKLAAELGFTEQQIRTALRKLESTGEITTKPTNRFTIVTINNWAFYQDGSDESNQQSNQRITNEQPTDNQQITTSKEGKESKKVRNKYIERDLPKNVLSAVKDFETMRTKMKKPMTDEAKRRFDRKLKSLATVDGVFDEELAIAIVNRSVDQGWTGIYEIKGWTQERKDLNEEIQSAKWDVQLWQDVVDGLIEYKVPYDSTPELELKKAKARLAGLEGA